LATAASATTDAASRARTTPARAQYLALKRQHPDALLLFRMGDFYETFDDDAKVVADVLGVALTSRPMGAADGRIPLAGVPYHSLERHLDRLVTAGHRVAIVEQTSPAGKGLVERRVVRVVTPGTVDTGALVDEHEHNWLVALAPAVAPAGATRWALAACDVTTGELECAVVGDAELAGEWARLRVREVLVPEGAELPAFPAEALITRRPARLFGARAGAEALAARLGAAGLEGFGVEGVEKAAGAAGALVEYLAEAWPGALAHLRPPRAVRAADYMYLDPQTRRNLDLFSGRRDGEASLAETLDRTQTAMGSRLLRARIGRPLRSRTAAEARLDAVEAFVKAPLPRAALRRALRGVPDLERLLGRIRAGGAEARVLVQLRLGLERLPELRAHAEAAGAVAARLAAGLGGGAQAAEAVRVALADDPPAELADGGTVRDGADAEVDALRALTADARGALAALETAERARTGLGALKVGYHRVFGYYWELPAAQAGKAPAEYEPRQTLANAQRYRSPALAALETRILGAREQLLEAERAIVERVRAQVAACGEAIAAAAESVAELDVAAAFAEVASEHGYVRPELADGGTLEIAGGRHPVVEQRLPRGAFVPNDCELGASRSRGSDIVLLSGPNMGGKSTYLRQVALTVLLAQCGCYVPATRARVPMCDRIFSRVGAQDDIAAGQSTFMVEMVETAAILHNATERSLVILDEVGRGTATRDGLAIARAVVEYLHHRPGGTPRTLFATHFQELAALAGVLPRVENRSVAVVEEAGGVVFLHRIVPGAADRAYGVHVAGLAGLPRAVVARAAALLHESETAATASAPVAPRSQLLAQPELGSASSALAAEVAAVEPDALTPLEALQRLYELRAMARRELGVEG
jgi:DNA mismatch repair protein MutS